MYGWSSSSTVIDVWFISELLMPTEAASSALVYVIGIVYGVPSDFSHLLPVASTDRAYRMSWFDSTPGVSRQVQLRWRRPWESTAACQYADLVSRPSMRLLCTRAHRPLL